MSDTETRFFVQAFVRFLNKQIVESGFPADTAESLEVAVQCLETAYNLPVDSPSEAGTSTDPMTHADLQQLFQIACAGHPDRKREAEMTKNEGNKLMREEKFEEALLSYNRAIGLDATNPVFYCNRAATYSRLGDFQKAAEDCKLSLRYDPKYSKAYGRLGIAYSKLNKLDLAVEAYKKALELEPNNVDYLNNLNVAKQQLEEANQAATNASANESSSGSRSTTSTGPGAFQLPPNFQMPGLEAMQSIISQPGVSEFVQQVVNDPNQLNAIYETFRGATGGDQQPGAGGGLAGLLSGAGGLNFQSLLSQFGNAAGGMGGPASGHDSTSDSSPSHP